MRLTKHLNREHTNKTKPITPRLSKALPTLWSLTTACYFQAKKKIADINIKN
jgi:hypothetical protein